jgi:hypothetical protein
MKLLMEKPGFNGRFICRDLGEMTEVLLMEGATGKNLVRAGTIRKRPGEVPDLDKMRMLVAEFYRGRQLYGITVRYALTDERGRLIDRGIVQDELGGVLLIAYPLLQENF